MSPCRHGASCRNTHGGYRCHCQAGYSGRNCETDIDDCRPSEWPRGSGRLQEALRPQFPWAGLVRMVLAISAQGVLSVAGRVGSGVRDVLRDGQGGSGGPQGRLAPPCTLRESHDRPSHGSSLS